MDTLTGAQDFSTSFLGNEIVVGGYKNTFQNRIHVTDVLTANDEVFSPFEDSDIQADPITGLQMEVGYDEITINFADLEEAVTIENSAINYVGIFDISDSIRPIESVEIDPIFTGEAMQDLQVLATENTISFGLEGVELIPDESFATLNITYADTSAM